MHTHVQDFFVGFGRGVLTQNFNGHWDLHILAIRSPDTLLKKERLFMNGVRLKIIYLWLSVSKIFSIHYLLGNNKQTAKLKKEKKNIILCFGLPVAQLIETKVMGSVPREFTHADIKCLYALPNLKTQITSLSAA